MPLANGISLQFTLKISKLIGYANDGLMFTFTFKEITKITEYICQVLRSQ